MIFVYNSDMLIRLVIAVVLGSFIGWERERSARPAGLRTHLLVCVGSTLMTIISVEGFNGADPARVAAQIVSGIGFLGAGTILKEGLTIKGLTTAASLWVVAGIGMAIGVGFYIPAAITTLIVFLTLSIVRVLEKDIIRSAEQKKFIFTARNHPGLLGVLGLILGEYGIDIESVQLKTNEELITIDFVVRLPNDVHLSDVVERLRHVESVISLEIL